MTYRLFNFLTLIFVSQLSFANAEECSTEISENDRFIIINLDGLEKPGLLAGAIGGIDAGPALVELRIPKDLLPFASEESIEISRSVTVRYDFDRGELIYEQQERSGGSELFGSTIRLSTDEDLQAFDGFHISNHLTLGSNIKTFFNRISYVNCR
ncbi:MAG: hypothetical protein HRU19_27225 [Pseudobacteriovorax sp.]|nr:hypothetical protein [Pseudobacteriovorax sp.]